MNITDSEIRPAWAKEGDVVLKWTDSTGKDFFVGATVYQKLTTIFRGQSNMTGSKASAATLDLISCIDDKPELQYFDGVEQTAPTLNHIKTKLYVKGTGILVGDYKVNGINLSKVTTKILKNKSVSVEIKDKVANHSRSKDSMTYKENRDKSSSSSSSLSSSSGQAQLADAEQQQKKAKRPADYKADERQSIFDGRRGVGKYMDFLSPGEGDALHFMLAMFFFMCNIPFAVINNYFFIAFITALRPAFAKVLKKKDWLRTSGLSDVYDEIKERSDARFAGLPGRKTIGIDGYKDGTRRHVMNITEVKRGWVTYKGTEWFGRLRHSGRTHANTILKYMGDAAASQYICVVADNTSSMKAMFDVLALTLVGVFFIGCVVHVYDLLVEDIAKIEEINETTQKFQFIIVFILSYSSLFELFKEETESTFGKGKTTMLKLFPMTRFAYASLMIHSVLVNWRVIVGIPDSPEFRYLKRKATPKRRADFAKFEDLLDTTALKKKGEAVVGVLDPISKALHVQEGDNFPTSGVAPLFTAVYNFTNELPLEITSQFKAGTGDEEEELTETKIHLMVSDRWLGTSRIVGLQHELHGLAYSMDVIIMCIVKEVMGESFHDAVMAGFTQQQIYKAIKTYAGGNQQKYNHLIVEYDSFVGGIHPDYAVKVDATKELVKTKLAEMVEKMDDATKGSPLLRLIYVLSEIKAFPTSRAWWAGVRKADSEKAEDVSEPRVALKAMGTDLDMIMSHACSVERVNKDHNFICAKIRSSLNPETIKKLLFIYVNGRYLHKSELSFDKFVAAMLSPDEARVILDELSTYTPPEALPATRNGEDEDQDEDELEDVDKDEGEDDDDDGVLDKYEIPEGFVHVPKPAALPEGDAEEDGKITNLFVLIMWEARVRGNDIWAWYLGKVMKFNKRRKHNYRIMWEDDGGIDQELKLENYKVDRPGLYEETLEVDMANKPTQTWCFVKKAAS